MFLLLARFVGNVLFMAKFTINVMGLKQEINLMQIIMQSVKRTGKYELKLKNNPTPEDLIANRLVQYKVLTRTFVRRYPNNTDYYEYNEGDNFAEENLKGAFKFIEQEKKRLNPNYLMHTWNRINDSTVISGGIGTLLGAILGWWLAC